MARIIMRWSRRAAREAPGQREEAIRCGSRLSAERSRTTP